MNPQEMTVEEILAQALTLSPLDKIKLLERLASTLKHDLETASPPLRSHRLYGLWANPDVRISEEDIDEARREMWENFPSEDI